MLANTRICLTSLYRGDDGIKLHIENLDIHAQHIADGIRHIHVDAHNLAILVIFEGSKVALVAKRRLVFKPSFCSASGPTFFTSEVFGV